MADVSKQPLPRLVGQTLAESLGTVVGRLDERVREGDIDEFLPIPAGLDELGKPSKDAWLDLVRRTQVPDLTSFVTAMLQNEWVGSSIGNILRVQAEHIRVRRRQRAEEAARVAPVKMLIPLVFFVFPGILVVLLGPAITQVLDVFGGR